jgi:hypothetical protein
VATARGQALAVGFDRFVALHDRPSTSYQIH